MTLIAPPDADKELFNYSTAKLNRYLNYPPYGFAVLAQLLRKVDVECKIISLQTAVLKAAKEIEEPESFDFDSSWKQELDGLGDSDTIALTCMFSQGQSISSRVMKYLHELYPGIPLIFGGVHVTNMLVEPHSRDLFLDDFPSCDLFFLFEADETLPAFIQAVNTSTPENFSVKYRPSQIYIRQIGLFPERKTPREANLDIIPAWDLIPPKQHSPWGKVGAFWYLRHRDPVT
ncbi:MAG: hypothetical protein EBW54_06810, partial [Betaproteobacteria bacterium]|nr:hypothetical protein [Betaproteobacteria bacterium]